MSKRYSVYYTAPDGGIEVGGEHDMLTLALDEAQRLFNKEGASDVSIYDETRRSDSE